MGVPWCKGPADRRKVRELQQEREAGTHACFLGTPPKMAESLPCSLNLRGDWMSRRCPSAVDGRLPASSTNAAAPSDSAAVPSDSAAGAGNNARTRPDSATGGVARTRPLQHTQQNGVSGCLPTCMRARERRRTGARRRPARSAPPSRAWWVFATRSGAGLCAASPPPRSARHRHANATVLLRRAQRAVSGLRS